MERSNKIAWFAVILIVYFAPSIEAKLKLLNVVFRHGDRAPVGGPESYPNDPYTNEDYYPMGFAGLTNAGKLREYHLGQYLRQEYGDFLGDVYLPPEVRVRSTDTDRTKMSAQLVLAGLYSPGDIQRWNHELDWQPIPIITVKRIGDVLMLPAQCPKYLKARKDVEALPEVVAKLNSFKTFMANLTITTGKKISTSNDMASLYLMLMSQKSLGLELPPWTDGIFPDGKLLDGINLAYEIDSYNTAMKKLNGGMLLRKFIKDMVASANGHQETNRKLFLYSGHEGNVASVLQALGVYYPHAPAYSSAVIVELHEERHQHFVKIKYYKGIPKNNEEKVQEMRIPGCYYNCTLDMFKENLRSVIPSNTDTQCDKRSLRNVLEEYDTIPYSIWKSVMDAIKEDDELRNNLY